MKASIVRLFLSAAVSIAAWGQGAPLPAARSQFFNNNGQPLASGQVCSFTSGTTSPLATFADYTLTTQNPQCVVLDSAGRASIWLDPTRVYRIVLRDSTGVTLWTADGVTGAIGGLASLWTQNGTTIYNSTGNRVCIGATPCTTALAVLNVAGGSSGNTHLIRIDDTASQPGIDLYGAGNYFGSYLGDSTGLRLRSANGSNQMTVANGAVTVQNGAATGGSTLNVRMSATQAAINPLQIQTTAGSNIAYMDPTGNLFLAGLNANGTANNIIQAPNGGVTGKFVIATDSLFLIEEPAPALSGAGQARIYADSTSHTLLLSQNGGAYAELGSGGGGGGGSFSGITTGTNVTATMTVGTGGTLTFSGSGIVNASRINGTTIPVSSAADQALVTSGSGVGAWKAIADCPDTGGNHVNYTGGSWSCGTSGGTVGSVSFGTITSATNTTSAMVVGTGASLNVSGSGQINATQINAGSPPSSGSVWVSNGILQPVTATFADIVGMFSGGSGCSGTNLLAANGTCQTGGGGGGVSLAGNNTWTGTNTYTLQTNFSTIAATGVINSTASGLALAFQAGGGAYQVFGNGAVNASNFFNTNSGYQIFGATVIDSGRNADLGGLRVRFSTVIDQAMTVSNTLGGRVFLGNSEWQPANDNFVALGDSSHRWSGLNSVNVQTSVLAATTGIITTALIGSASFSGTISAPAGATLNGTFNCPGGQHIATLVVSQGLLTNYACTP